MCTSIMAKFWIIITLCVSSFCSSEAQGGDSPSAKGSLYQDGLEIPTVKFSNTTVQGVQQETLGKRNIDAFLGIPYAEPPIGDLSVVHGLGMPISRRKMSEQKLRFRNPVPYVYRDVTLLATEKAPRCLHEVQNVQGDEDCLYLNVYRPRSIGNQSLPVMVYFQAADFTPREGIPEITGYYLLDEDIVLVTLTYRLGVFSFLSTGDDQVTGNFGLKDQKVALQWVQSNIEAFGGNPSRVTLFGNGQAAESIHYHTLVNHTDGLFQQYILQSGTALGPWSVCNREIHENRTVQVANEVGCPSDTTWKIADCLRKVESGSLLSSSMRLFTKMDIALLKTWTPIKEPVGPGAFLTECPADLFARNQQRNLPFIAGVVREEMPAVLPAIDTSGAADVVTKIASEVTPLVEMILGSPDLVERVNQFYFRGILYNRRRLWEEDRSLGAVHLSKEWEHWFHMTTFFENLINDIYYYHPTVKVLEQQRLNSIHPFYFYYFDFQGVWTFRKWYGGLDLGSTHGDELLHLFPYNTNQPPGTDASVSLAERDFLAIRTMVELWTSFAIQGVPRTSGIDDWPPYDSEGQYVEIGYHYDPKITLKSNFQPERMKWWGNTTWQTCD